jgi:secondary thiamine-phosphate synthase enzyme
VTASGSVPSLLKRELSQRETFKLHRRRKLMQRLIVKTRKKREVVDVTKTIEVLLQKNHSQGKGICNLFILHTTAALTTADLDPGTDLDMLDAFEAMIPKLHYRHPHNPAHVPDHILSALIGTSVALPFEHGQIVLGTWQRIVLIELDGPRERELVMSVSPEK